MRTAILTFLTVLALAVTTDVQAQVVVRKGMARKSATYKRTTPVSKKTTTSPARVSRETTRVETEPARITTTSTVETEEDGKIYETVEQMPKFPGGDAALLSYLASNTQYPTVAAANGIQGRVVVGFVVECDGSLTDVKILRSVDPSLDKEAMRVVKSMPKWTPGMLDGSPARVKYRLPVSFKLQ